MTETPKDRLSPTSLADLDQDSPFNLVYQAWRQGNPLPLAAYIRENGIRSQWEADILANIATEGDRLKARGNSTEKAVQKLRLYAHIKGDLKLSWDEVYRRVSHITRKSEEALKKLRKREGIK
ncbi:MAG: hypothetical protein RLZ25_666 [Pseudomonadota bacterium]|jgi:hypothetical protein